MASRAGATRCRDSALQSGHQLRKEIGRDRRDNAKAQTTTQCLLPLRAHEGFQLIHRAQDRAGTLGKGLTRDASAGPAAHRAPPAASQGFLRDP